MYIYIYQLQCLRSQCSQNSFPCCATPRDREYVVVLVPSLRISLYLAASVSVQVFEHKCSMNVFIVPRIILLYHMQCG